MSDVSHTEVPDDWAGQALEFWFDELSPDDWWGGSDELDEQITERFRDWWMALRGFDVSHFLSDPQTALAAVILFDQFPRNMFRGTAMAFASDVQALQIAKLAMERGFDEPLNGQQKHFLHMPFMHSEDLDDQRRSLLFFSEQESEEVLDFARKHYEIIKEFGRFSHRNAVLGRQTRPEEESAVAEGADW